MAHFFLCCLLLCGWVLAFALCLSGWLALLRCDAATAVTCFVCAGCFFPALKLITREMGR